MNTLLSLLTKTNLSDIENTSFLYKWKRDFAQVLYVAFIIIISLLFLLFTYFLFCFIKSRAIRLTVAYDQKRRDPA